MNYWRKDYLMCAYSVITVTRNDIEHYELVVGKKIIVVIPAFNEERFIGTVVLKEKKYSDTVIVVDDGSDDDTSEISASDGALVVRHQINQVATV